MPTLNLSLSITGIGGSIARSTPRTSEGGGNREVSIPAGKAGTLTTRTDNETGSLTLGSGHGIVTGQVIDLFWSGGARYGITVGTVSGTTVPIGADNSGTGDNLPSAATAIVASPRTLINADVDGDNVSALACQMVYASNQVTSQSHASFQDASSDIIAAIDMEANTPRLYDVTGGDANPFTGDPITKIYVSNGSSAAAGTFKLLWLQDPTP